MHRNGTVMSADVGLDAKSILDSAKYTSNRVLTKSTFRPYTCNVCNELIISSFTQVSMGYGQRNAGTVTSSPSLGETIFAIGNGQSMHKTIHAVYAE